MKWYKTDPEFYNHVREAQKLAKTLTGTSAVVSYGFHTLAKAHMAKLRRMISNEEETVGAFGFAEIIKDTEAVLQNGLQRFPDDPYLLAAESDLGDLLLDDLRSITPLQTAFHHNPHNPFIVVRLAKILVRANKIDEARMVYKKCLEAGVVDKHVHYNYAKLLIDSNDGNGVEVEYHLRRAFTDGDKNGETQFWYARQLYINGNVDDAQARFRQLKQLRGNPVAKRSIRGLMLGNGGARKYTGAIAQLVADYGFVTRDGRADRVYLHPNNIEATVWERLERGTRISFAIGFNYWGATAVEVCLES